MTPGNTQPPRSPGRGRGRGLDHFRLPRGTGPVTMRQLDAGGRVIARERLR